MRSTKRVLYSGLAAVGIVAGAAGLANAATNGGGTTDTVAVTDPSPAADPITDNDAQQDPSHASSVTVLSGDHRGNDVVTARRVR